eukprot:4432406-Karenia_brevis.AAC.1
MSGSSAGASAVDIDMDGCGQKRQAASDADTARARPKPKVGKGASMQQVLDLFELREVDFEDTEYLEAVSENGGSRLK